MRHYRHIHALRGTEHHTASPAAAMDGVTCCMLSCGQRHLHGELGLLRTVHLNSLNRQVYMAAAECLAFASASELIDACPGYVCCIGSHLSNSTWRAGGAPAVASDTRLVHSDAVRFWRHQCCFLLICMLRLVPSDPAVMRETRFLGTYGAAVATLDIVRTTAVAHPQSSCHSMCSTVTAEPAEVRKLTLLVLAWTMFFGQGCCHPDCGAEGCL